VAVDLGSKNGTRIAGEALTKHVLSDGDVLHMGKIQVCFKDGPFVPAPQQSNSRDMRPEDPQEALAGTVMGFQYFDMEEDSKISGFPIPKPKPAEPKSYQHEEVHSIVTQMSSSAWDLALTEPDMHEKPPAKTPEPVKKRKQAIEKEKAGTISLLDPPPPVVRDPSPDESAKVSRWLAWLYVLMAVGLGALSLWVLVGHVLMKLLKS
jgi:hypothetical protein